MPKFLVELNDGHNDPIIHTYSSIEEAAANIAARERELKEDVLQFLEEDGQFLGLDSYTVIDNSEIDRRIKELEQLKYAVNS